MARELPNKEEMELAIETYKKDRIKYAREEAILSLEGLDLALAIAEKVMPTLPDTWGVEFKNWGALVFSNHSGEGTVPKEEFMLARKIVEQAAGIKLTVNASFDEESLSYLHGTGYIQNKAQRSLLQVSVLFYRGDCKIVVDEKTVRQPRLLDPCLGFPE